MMKRTLVTILTVMLLSGCSEFQKALKSEDIAEKFKLGTELFEAGKYEKANRLFTQIVPQYRGRPQAEKLMYMYCMTFYQNREYYTANYQMERFVSSYPSSEKIEEVAFLSAKSIYHLSPVYTKQQTETIDALEKLQVFINRFPESEYLEEANTLIKELDYKLEQKAYSIAKQYNLISDYQASIKSFDNFLLDYPGSRLREEALYYRFDAAYKLAINSVEFRQEERINKALGYFQSLKSAYPESGFMEAAEQSKAEMEQLLQQPDTKS